MEQAKHVDKKQVTKRTAFGFGAVENGYSGTLTD